MPHLSEGDGAALVREKPSYTRNYVCEEGTHLSFPGGGGCAVHKTGDIGEPEGEATEIPLCAYVGSTKNGQRREVMTTNNASRRAAWHPDLAKKDVPHA